MKNWIERTLGRFGEAAFVVKIGVALSVIIGLAGAATAVSRWGTFFQTADQQGQRLLDANQPESAAKVFQDPARRAMALFDAGEFKEAAKGFAGLPGPDAAFNHGNSLVMMGKYEDAVKRYDRALQLRPDWRIAEENRVIAAGRAERVKQEGGEEGTGGQLGADEIVFHDKPSNKGDNVDIEQEAVDGQQDELLRSVWLRQVQTTPSQFLRMKFAYQQSEREQRSAEDGETSQ